LRIFLPLPHHTGNPVPEPKSRVRESKGPVYFNFISTLGIVAHSKKIEGKEQRDRDRGEKTEGRGIG
jgi:hypothetical protein